ncbi:ArsR family transcriptional regulator [Thermotomaculum hydrothermale]|uniref:ArsR family transcriptional regulator n=1 Tax=Thermotomaculum hydrothermale TaxID=981385 RepID=A0A7R6PWF4_9BACT|nr:metalloregulator ArsR/SmtB family transcription factor [Thermotomaculum hydrothermale]BBB31865.1 ArsR family transcriptional regulator [Thermotomaculum hydrothermale]
MKFNENNLTTASECLKVLSHPLRLMILFLIKDQSLNVSSIEKLTGATQSNVSQHLAIMRYNGMVKQEKKGNEVYYTVATERLKKLLELIGELLCEKH